MVHAVQEHLQCHSAQQGLVNCADTGVAFGFQQGLVHCVWVSWHVQSECWHAQGAGRRVCWHVASMVPAQVLQCVQQGAVPCRSVLQAPSCLYMPRRQRITVSSECMRMC